jgi:predicted unusual protein kinase regulating ubiquinone biosynthesis (AarF/ABC1/UbiB family)
MDRYINTYREYMRTIDVSAMRTIHEPSKGELPIVLTDKFVRLIRVYGMLEGTCKALDPEFNYFSLLDDYIDDLFFDEEFVMYKVDEDVRSLMPMLRQLMAQPLPVPSDPSERPSNQQQQQRLDLANLSAFAQGVTVMYLLLERLGT